MRSARKASILATLVVAATFVADSATAGVAAELPAPGVLGLVAIGVVAAVALARWRK